MNHDTYRIGDVCSLVKGTYPTMKTEPGEYPLVVTAEYRRSASTYQLAGPAVCVPLISSTGHGDAALHRVHYQEGKFALANLLVALLPKNPRLCDAKYLYHLLMARKDELLVPLMLGTANVSLKQRDIAGVEIPLPPLTEQRRTVARIEELADRIEKARGLRRQAMEEAEALVSSAGAGVFDSFTNTPRNPVETSCDVRGGIQKSSKRTPGANPRRYITVAHVQRNWIDTNDERYFEVSNAELERWRLHDGDVLVIEGNGSAEQIGRAALFRGEIEDCVHQNHVIRVRPDKARLLPEFLNAYFNSSAGRHEMLERSRTTSGLFNLSVGRIKQIEIPFPSLEEQRDTVIYLDYLQAKVDSLKRLQAETAAELDALLPSVLDRAFKGEL